MEKNVKSLTVITYIHPEERLLHRCVEGLGQQNIDFIWLILGYEDPKLEDQKYTFWKLDKSIENKAQAYNYALPNITTTYIAYNDADDISLPNRFKKQVDFLEKHTNIDVLGGNLTINGTEAGWTIYKNQADIQGFLLINNPIVNSTVMLRNTAIKWGIDIQYDSNFSRAEDYDFWWKAAQADVIFANLEDSLIDYYQDTNFAKEKELQFAQIVREKVLIHYNSKELSQIEIDLFHKFAERNLDSKKEHRRTRQQFLELLPNISSRPIKNHHFNDSSLINKIKGLKIF